MIFNGKFNGFIMYLLRLYNKIQTPLTRSFIVAYPKQLNGFTMKLETQLPLCPRRSLTDEL